MFKDIKTGQFMYPIDGFEKEGYYISRDGTVGKMYHMIGDANRECEFNYVKPYIYRGHICVTLYTSSKDSIKYRVANLLLDSLYGILPFKIKYVDENPTNINPDNLLYIYDKVEVIENCKLIADDKEYTGEIMIISDKKGRAIYLKPIPESYISHGKRYWITTNGAVYDIKKNRFVPRSNDGHRYYKVGITTIDGNHITPKIHTLVYVTWSGDTDMNGWTIDHLNGFQHDNRFENLEKVTFQENVRRMHDAYVGEIGFKNSKWTFDQINTVCKMVEKRERIEDISEALGMSRDKSSKEYLSVANLINCLIHKRTFTDISSNYDLPILGFGEPYQYSHGTPTYKYSEEDVKKVCELIISGMSARAIHELIPHVSEGTIKGIRIGDQYRHISEKIPGMDKFLRKL